MDHFSFNGSPKLVDVLASKSTLPIGAKVAAKFADGYHGVFERTELGWTVCELVKGAK